MRIIAGRQQRRKLAAPRGLGTRPMLDRVKQALFDALGARYGLPGELPPLRVLDLYCGGGTLGIEALSRGAAWCTFVERDSQAVRCLRSNLETAHLASRSRIVAGPAESAPVPPPPDGPYNLIFMDPPFPLSAAFDARGPLGRVWSRFGDDIPVAADALCIWRYEAGVSVPDRPAGWTTRERRKYGRSMLSWLVREKT